MLAARREAILKVIVGEHISTAAPVASETIARGHPLGVSPATIRLDMAALEEEGFIFRPHSSAGRMPSDKGYRYYVEYLELPQELPLGEQRLIQHLFHQVEGEMEEWLRLTSAILCRLSSNVAMVTFPRSSRCQFKHLELVALHELRVLLVLVLSQAQLRQRLLSLNHPVTQEELTATANKLNQAYAEHYAWEIAEQELSLEPLEVEITQLILRIMEAEEGVLGETYITGLSNLLSQPEFWPRNKLARVMETVEAKTWLNQVVPLGEGVKVVIGQENQEEAMRGCSLVLGHYGLSHSIGGLIGILGPTRMRYGNAVSAVRYLSDLLRGLMEKYYA